MTQIIDMLKSLLETIISLIKDIPTMLTMLFKVNTFLAQTIGTFLPYVIGSAVSILIAISVIYKILGREG